MTKTSLTVFAMSVAAIGSLVIASATAPAAAQNYYYVPPLSAGIQSLNQGANVSPFPSMNDMMAPQYLRMQQERNELLRQEIEMRRQLLQQQR